MTKRSFTIHPAIIYDVIQRQSGTIGKALLELVMNSRDAGSDRVDIEINREGFTATDQGRGFRDQREITDWFETFGTPHEEGDAVYGKFRMGRGQIMAFAVTDWRTGTFRMQVDIKGKGLDYDLSTDLPVHKGCRIEGTWYKALSAQQVKAAVKELKEMVEYADFIVTVNGESVSKAPGGEAWDKVTEDAYIRYEAQGGLKVYNLGVMVRSYPGYMHGCCGVVVSRKQLQLNTARNEIIQSECMVWARVKEILSEYAQEKARNTIRLDADARRHLMDGLATGAVEAEAVKDARIIEAMDGRKLRLSDLANKQVIVAPAGDTRADFIAQTRKDVIVVDAAFVTACGLETPEEFQEVVKTAVAKVEGEKKAEQIVIEDAEEVLSSVSKARSALRMEDLTAEGKAFLGFMDSINSEVIRMISQRSGYRPKTRRLLAGESDSAYGWTNGSTYIYLERHKLERPLDLHNATDVLMLLVHEYLHDTSDEDQHGHDLEFYKGFHDIVVYDWFGDQPMTCWLASKMVRAGLLAA